MLGGKQHTRVKNMPRGPKGERRPADVNARAVMIAKIATGQIEDIVPSPENEGKDPAAVALGRRGGKARAEKMSKKQRATIAKKAARARWAGR
jgi:RNase adaptor protein for sRNA GlmZ degradation